MTFQTITDADWAKALRASRKRVNQLDIQIKEHLMKLHPENPTPLPKPSVVTYTKNEPHGNPAYYTCLVGKAVIGSIDQEVDGFYYFTPAKWDNKGFVASWILHDIAHKLDALNEAWNLRLTKELNG